MLEVGLKIEYFLNYGIIFMKYQLIFFNMKNPFKFKKILLGLIFLAFFIYIFSHYSEIDRITALFSKINVFILLGLVLIEYLFLANRANIFYYIFRKLGINITKLNSFLIFIASYSLNVITPTAGVSGIALYANQAEKLKTSKTKMILANGIFYFIGYVSLAILLVLSLIYLWFLPDFSKNYLLVLFMISLLLLVIIFVIYLAFTNFSFLNWFISKTTRFINKLLKVFKISQINREMVEKIFKETRVLKKLFIDNNKNFWYIIMLFFVGNVLEIITLYLILYNFGVSAQIISVTVVYVIGILFMLASITPSGVGIVEPIMAWLFTSFGIPLETALITVLIFRAVTFWLPIPFGVFVIKKYIHD